jgi:UDP-N-acetylglucosamine--N-acetylmuramyl-(pentapeptide) pyrophosphoryl-undecaprenol N-acetylglucosamine transferase
MTDPASANRSKTAVIAAGGTGGHLFPAAAFAQELQARGWRVVLITDVRGRRYAKDFPAAAVHDIPAATIQGANPFKAAGAALTIWKGIAAAKKLLADLDPRVVAGFGGYPSLPALFAAKDQRRPILIHEQNAVLGRVNRLFANDAAVVACGFDRLDRLPASAQSRKVVTGNPVRPPILAARAQPYPALPAGGEIRILVIGGSQGARILGVSVPAAIERLAIPLRARLLITQQAREEQTPEVQALYAKMGVRAEVQAFFSDMGPRLAATHLVIARAGASTVTELQAVGRPSILVPLAIAADDHQTANADSLVSVGAADIALETQGEEALTQSLTGFLAQRLSDPHGLSVRAAAARSAGKPEAAKHLADIAESLSNAA